MLIIIEGPDGAGKTTLAGAIEEEASRQKIAVFRRSARPPRPPDRNPFEEYEATLLREPLGRPGNEILRQDLLVIQDRWAMGELIYGPLKRGASRLSAGGLLHCEMLAMAHGAIKIAMIPSLGIVVKRLQKNGDWLLLPEHKRGDLFDTGEITMIWDSYSSLAPLYWYDVLRRQPDVSHILALLARARYRAEWSGEVQAKVPGYIGSQRPGVILAGDVRSGAGDPDPAFTHAFTPAGPGSALYLMDALAIHCRQVLRSFGILNTGEEGMDLKIADDLLGPRQWIALGVSAARRLDEAGIEYVQVAHPQWQRRFRHNEIAGYAAQIMTAAESQA